MAAAAATSPVINNLNPGQYVGFDSSVSFYKLEEHFWQRIYSITRQIETKLLKRGFQFNVMVCLLS